MRIQTAKDGLPTNVHPLSVGIYQWSQSGLTVRAIRASQIRASPIRRCESFFPVDHAGAKAYLYISQCTIVRLPLLSDVIVALIERISLATSSFTL